MLVRGSVVSSISFLARADAALARQRSAWPPGAGKTSGADAAIRYRGVPPGHRHWNLRHRRPKPLRGSAAVREPPWLKFHPTPQCPNFQDGSAGTAESPLGGLRRPTDNSRCSSSFGDRAGHTGRQKTRVVRTAMKNFPSKRGSRDKRAVRQITRFNSTTALIIALTAPAN